MRIGTHGVLSGQKVRRKTLYFGISDQEEPGFIFTDFRSAEEWRLKRPWSRKVDIYTRKD